MQTIPDLKFDLYGISKRTTFAASGFGALFSLLFSIMFFSNVAIAGHMLIEPSAGNKESTLVDKVCAFVGSERPILYSEVMKRAKELGEVPEMAQRELIKEQALMLYARKQVTYNAAEVKKAVRAHINKIIEANRLTRERFEKILRAAPYNSSISQYEHETEYHLIKSQVDASIASTIEITPKMVELEMARRKKMPKEFSIAFVTIAQSLDHKGNASVKRQFDRVKSIREEISKMKTLDEIKKNFSGQSDISIGDLMDYEEGTTLIGHYEQQIKKNPFSRVSEPFIDNGAVTMIVKFEKKIDKETALENVRKDLYKRALKQRHDAITNITQANLPVTIICKW